MRGFVQGADRQQTTLLPECLDDWIDEGNSIRAVDVFVDALELRDHRVFRQTRLADAVCIEAAPVTMSLAPNAAILLESARQSRWQGLVAAARAQNEPSAQKAATREAVHITVQRQEEIQKPGYFVTNRRPR